MVETATGARADEIRKIVGDPAIAARRLRAFRRTALRLAEERFVDRYPNRWVAVRGDQILDADSLDALLEEMDAVCMPRAGTIVRFFDTEDRVLIV